MSLREIVATNLQRLRRAKRMSQEELAARADINRSCAGMLERNEPAPTIEMLEKRARGLGVDSAHFLQRDT
jgi:transcriptional regulator with XRE-family HTH domain